jgi:hypothetical protein
MCHRYCKYFRLFPVVPTRIKFSAFFAVINSRYFSVRSRDSSVSIVIRLRTECSRNNGSVPGRELTYLLTSYLLSYLLPYLFIPYLISYSYILIYVLTYLLLFIYLLN